MPFAFGGTGTGGGAGGPAPNTILWAVAQAATNEASHTLRIARIEPMVNGAVNPAYPIETDQVTVDTESVVIAHVSNPTGVDYTQLSLEDDLGIDVAAGDLIRIDRLIHAEVVRDTIDGAVSGPSGTHTQARAQINGQNASDFHVTLRDSFAALYGAEGNDVTLNVVATGHAGAHCYLTHDEELTSFTVHCPAIPSIGELRSTLEVVGAAYFTVGALTGAGGNTLIATSWTFSGGDSGTPGSTQITLDTARPEVEVGDAIYFRTGLTPARRRVITAVDAAHTGLTFTPQADFTYADEATVDIERPIGYFEATASATGPRGLQGDEGWSPVFAVVTDGDRRVLRLVAYVGGEGTAPTIPTDNYVGASGLTTLASAVDVRGAAGPSTGLLGRTRESFSGTTLQHNIANANDGVLLHYEGSANTALNLAISPGVTQWRGLVVNNSPNANATVAINETGFSATLARGQAAFVWYVSGSTFDGVVIGDGGGGPGSGLSSVATDATLTGDGTSGDPLKVANPFEAADETNLDTLVDRDPNKVIPYKIGNVYMAQASATPPTKPADGSGSGNTASGVVTATSITTPPAGWVLVRPEATESLPNVFDMHVYGYEINGAFQWQFGTPNRTDRYVSAGAVDAGTVRGDAIARTTGTFPASSVNFGDAISGVTWQAVGNLHAVVQLAGLNLIVRPTTSHDFPPESAFGIMFVAETVVGEVVTEIGIPTIVTIDSYQNDNADTRPALILSASQRLVVANQLRDAATDGHGHILRGGGTTFPANLRVSAYWAVVRGARGPAGAQGPSVAAQDEGSQLAAAMTAINFTGAGVTASATGSVVTVSVPGSPAPTMHNLYAAWSSDATVTATEVLAGASSDTNTVTIPTGTGDEFLAFWRADADGGDPSEVHIAAGGNIRNTFGTAAALTVDSVAGQLIVSTTTQNRALLGGEPARIV